MSRKLACLSDRNSSACSGIFARRRLRDGEDLAHIFGKQLAKVLRVGRNGSPLVPLNDQSLPQRLASVCDADDSQNIAIGCQD